jgi:hypothetical protein
MFEKSQDGVPGRAWLETMFESCHPSVTPESAALVERICAAARAENRAAAARLVAVGELVALRLRRGAAEEWAIDALAAVSAEVAAALRISQGLAGSYARYARAMRERLPRVADVFAAGDIDLRLFQTLVFRTDLVTDPEILAAVDAQLAVLAPRWPSMTRGRLAAHVDKVVARLDRDAVRRRREAAQDRQVWIDERCDGLSDVHATLITPDAQALGRRLDALAATVCAQDPRTREQRRADAVGALAAGVDRLACRCGRPDCAAGATPAAGPVVIHVIAEQATLDGVADAPGSTVGADGLLPPELIKELAQSARLRPLAHPGDAPPEPGYTPSRALADFVRCRDLTCRWPGCDQPAAACDLDHTIPYGRGGPTHASNLKCYCRTHHLVKTFWGWRDRQLPDGTVILTSPTGHTYVTTPGSALLFPGLCAPTGHLDIPEVPVADPCWDRTAMMPTRSRTRAQNHAQRIATERQHNRQARQARRHAELRAWQAKVDADEPPPF